MKLAICYVGQQGVLTPFVMGADFDDVSHFATGLGNSLAENDQGDQADTVDQMGALEAQNLVIQRQTQSQDYLAWYILVSPVRTSCENWFWTMK